ncbi:hypothetical protein M426DRAFT_13378 [Hypoxylon sp. CI-4A]|nr:hypothetical protein M426DRAFT_13378 [Hypoxylon sp. CI-4A]
MPTSQGEPTPPIPTEPPFDYGYLTKLLRPSHPHQDSQSRFILRNSKFHTYYGTAAFLTPENRIRSTYRLGVHPLRDAALPVPTSRKVVKENGPHNNKMFWKLVGILPFILFWIAVCSDFFI